MDESEIRVLRERLLAHYDEHRRTLPWRGEVDPYAVWVSEVMLQQTRVDTVVPYYERWMQSFPTVDALASATQDDVLKHWEGLGYYSRARNLHGAAIMVRERFEGVVPQTRAELRMLPGVGTYTSGAIASIAFGERVPAVDGNVRRILARLCDEPSPSPSYLERHAGVLLDPERPGDFNQALMDLGATVCTPRQPDCDACPWAGMCRAKARGTVDLRPLRKTRPRVPEIVHRVTVFLCAPLDGDAAVLLRRRPEDGLLGGLWECPTAVVEGGASDDAESGSQPLPTVLHRYSHFRAEYRPSLVHVRERTSVEGMTWFTLKELTAVALPVAQRRILDSALDLA